MKIVHSRPPNYDLLALMLPVSDDFVYCYGDIIYNPSGKELPPDIIFHESIHKRQQGENIDLWYNKYITDPHFRFQQELEAYGEQYSFLCQHIQDPKFRAKQKESMALALSGEAYGNLVSYGEAESKIRNWAKR